MKTKRIPSWYRVFAERRLAKLELAEILSAIAEKYINLDLPNMAQKYLLRAKRILE